MLLTTLQLLFALQLRFAIYYKMCQCYQLVLLVSALTLHKCVELGLNVHVTGLYVLQAVNRFPQLMPWLVPRLLLQNESVVGKVVDLYISLTEGMSFDAICCQKPCLHVWIAMLDERTTLFTIFK